MHMNQGHGCPKCVKRQIYTSEYYIKNNIPDHLCYLYLAEFKYKDEVFLKLGITKHEKIKYRFRGYTDFEISILVSFKSTFLEVYALEQKYLEMYKDFKYTPLIKFKGHTESLDIGCKNQLLSSLLEIVEENSL